MGPGGEVRASHALRPSPTWLAPVCPHYGILGRPGPGPDSAQGTALGSVHRDAGSGAPRVTPSSRPYTAPSPTLPRYAGEGAPPSRLRPLLPAVYTIPP